MSSLSSGVMATKRYGAGPRHSITSPVKVHSIHPSSKTMPAGLATSGHSLPAGQALGRLPAGAYLHRALVFLAAGPTDERWGDGRPQRWPMDAVQRERA